MTDETGQIRTQYNYSPFGETELLGEPSDNPFQYTGRENDNTGFYYYRARYYSPRLKRFVSEDPIRLRGGINFFIIGGNNPINFIDPLGLSGCIPQVCRYGPVKELRKEYDEWKFMFSRIEGPEAGSFCPAYVIECWWKRRVAITYGYTITCRVTCWDDCGGSTSYITTELKTFTINTFESTMRGKTFLVTHATAYVVPDLYCLQYLRP